MNKTDLSAILRSKSSVLTFKEVLIASGETRPDLLRRRLNYYVKQGELYALRRGMYVRDEHYDRLELATKICTPSYVSFETILAEAGVIFQHYKSIFVATYQTKEIECDGQTYAFRKLKDALLTNGAGLENRGAYYVASKERAFLDTLYLNKEYHFDNVAPLDFDKVRSLLPIYNNKRMAKAVDRFIKAFELDRR